MDLQRERQITCGISSRIRGALRSLERTWGYSQWIGATVFVLLLAYGTRLVAWHLLFPMWLYVSPGPTISNALRNTSMSSLAPDVRFLFLYVPECLMLLGISFAVGRVLPRNRTLFTVLLLMASCLAGIIQGGSPLLYAWRAMHTYRWDRFATYVAFSMIIFACGVLGAWAGSNRRRKVIVRKGFCRECGYDLTGLPTPRCPECGTPFEPEDIIKEARSSGTR